MADRPNKTDLRHAEGEIRYWHTTKELRGVLSEVRGPTGLQRAFGTHRVQELAVGFVIQKHILHFY